MERFVFKVNSGEKVRFWDHKWLGDEPLLAVFPILHRISTQKEAMVADLVGIQVQNWNLQFKRPLCSWEVHQVNILQNLLNTV